MVKFDATVAQNQLTAPVAVHAGQSYIAHTLIHHLYNAHVSTYRIASRHRCKHHAQLSHRPLLHQLRGYNATAHVF